MIKITDKLINQVSEKAKTAERKRCNHNFHLSAADPIQRFLNATEPGTYVRPHKHETPDKAEILIILQGSALIVEFDDIGNIIDHFKLDNRAGNRGIEIPPRKWHTFIALEEGTVLYEIKQGPFDPETDKVFAEWAPEEGTIQARELNKRILDQLNIAFS